MRQGDVYLHTFKPPDKTRPVLILTRSDAIEKLNSVTVAPITTTIRIILSQVWLDESDGMDEACVISLDNIQTVQKDKLGKFVTNLSLERMREVRKAIEVAFDLKNL